MLNLYHILSLEAGADASEIKSSFRKLAKRYHPDVNPDVSANEKFNEVYMAYEILGDAEKRRLYDQLLNDSHEDIIEVEEHEESYVREWQQQAYRTASGYGNMSYADFRRQKILLHQWSKNIYFEYAVSFFFFLLFLFAIAIIYSALPYEGGEKVLAYKERQLGFGFLVTLVCVFVLGHFIKIQLNNLSIKRD